jgi:hypothetical protein
MPNEQDEQLLTKAIADVPRIVNGSIENAPGILLLAKTPEESRCMLHSLVMSALFLGRARIGIGDEIDHAVFAADLHTDVEVKVAWHAGYTLGVSSLKGIHISLPPF